MGLSPNKEKQKNSLANLKPFTGYKDGMTEEERQRVREIASKGGKATQECNRKARTWKEVCNSALTAKVSKEKAEKYLHDDVDLLVFDENGTVDMQDVITVRALQIANEGNVKALEFIRDTSGQKPKDEMQITADVMTDADRRLLDNIAERLNGVKCSP